MAFDLVSAGCVAVVSGYLTLLLVSESEPQINEDGEEEYTLGGYLLLCTANGIKRLLGHKKVNRDYENVIVFESRPRFEDVEDEDDENELVV